MRRERPEVRFSSGALEGLSSLHASDDDIDEIFDGLEVFQQHSGSPRLDPIVDKVAAGLADISGDVFQLRIGKWLLYYQENPTVIVIQGADKIEGSS